MVKYTAKNVASTPYTGIIQKYLNEDVDDAQKGRPSKKATFTPVHDDRFLSARKLEAIETPQRPENVTISTAAGIKEVFGTTTNPDEEELPSSRWKQNLLRILRLSLTISLSIPAKRLHNRYMFQANHQSNAPDFVYEHPYVTSSYYTATTSISTLISTQKIQVDPKRDRPSDQERGITSRLAIVRPFCEFDAEGLPSTFTCWNSLVPCRAAESDLGEFDDNEEEEEEWVLFDRSVNGTGRKLNPEEEEDWECQAEYDSGNSWFRGVTSLWKKCRRIKKKKDYFDDVPADGLRTTSADLFLFYSQTFADSPVAMKAVDEITKEFFSPGGRYFGSSSLLFMRHIACGISHSF